MKSSNREYIVDSGASRHMMGRHSPSPDEQETVRPTDRIYSIQTSTSVVEFTHEANVFAHELHNFVNVKLVDDSPGGLILGKVMRRNEIPLHR